MLDLTIFQKYDIHQLLGNNLEKAPQQQLLTHRPKAVHVKVLLFRPVQPVPDPPIILKKHFPNAPISKKRQKNFPKENV